MLGIIAPNYKVAIEYSLLLKYENLDIISNGSLLKFEKNKNIYNLISNVDFNGYDNLNLEVNVQNSNISYIDDIFEIRKIARDYQYIALDDDLRSLLIDLFGSVECSYYYQSVEGKRWLKLFALDQEFVYLEDLRSLEVFQDHKKFNNEFFEYLNFPLAFENKKDLYFYFFKEYPIYIPEKLDQSFFQLFFVNINEQPNMIVDKLLIKYITEEVLYIGADVFAGAKNQIIFNPKFHGYSSFAKKNVAIAAEGYYQEKELAKGNFSRVYSMQHDIFSNEYNFYFNYKKYLKNLLYLICVKRQNINWEDSFKINHEFFKLLEKTKKIIFSFNLFMKEIAPKNLEKYCYYNNVKWDFFSLDSLIAIDIMTSSSNEFYLYKQSYCLSDYFLISESGYSLISDTKKLKFQDKKEGILEDDLFYWDNLEWINSQNN